MKTMRKFVVFLTVLALTVSCFAMTAAATAEEEIIPAETAPVETVPEPEPTEPESTEMPEATEPEATEPEATEPEATEPETTEPEETEEIVIEPELNGSDGESEEPTIVESGKCGDNLTWTLDSEGLLTISGIGAMDNYETAESSPWFSAREQITSLVIENGVTAIGKRAFASNVSLASVSLPNTLTSIGYQAFNNCDTLTTITLPDSVTTVEGYVFSSSDNLKNVQLSSGMTEVPDGMFSRCTSLESVTIPSNVTKIGYSAFGYSGIESITIPGNVTSIGMRAFEYCQTLESVNILSGVTEILGGAFQVSGIKSITIPESVTSIGGGAFSYCQALESVYIPSSITTINGGAFRDCIKLVSVTGCSGVTSIDDSAFNGCAKLISIAGCSNVTFIGTSAFKNCKSLEFFTIPAGVTSLGVDSFNGCKNLLGITIPAGLTDIGYGSFSKCDKLWHVLYMGTTEQWDALEKQYLSDVICHCNAKGDEIVIDDGTYDSCVFDAHYNCQICGESGGDEIPDGEHTWVEGNEGTYCSVCNEKITVVESGTWGSNLTWTLNSIDQLIISGTGKMAEASEYSKYPWSGKTFNEIIIESGVTSVANYAFQNTRSAREVVISNTVKSIGIRAFERVGIQNISIPDSVMAIGNYAFKDNPIQSIRLPRGLQEVSEGVFESCNQLTEVELPDSVTKIGNRAFYDCTKLAEINFHSNLKTLGEYAFYSCDAFTALELPDSITQIGIGAFEYCINLEVAVLPDNLKVISTYTFRNCSKLQLVVFPSKVTTIESSAFEHCVSLEYVELPDTVTQMGHSVFKECSKLQAAYLSTELTVLPESAFERCGSLALVVIPAKMTTIERNAFLLSNALEAVYFLGNEEQFEDLTIDYGNDILGEVYWYFLTYVTKEPEDVTTSAGMTASFTVEASRENCTYQWYYADEDDEDWVICDDPAAKNATYTVTATEDINDRWYCCQIFDEYGSEFWSDYAVLTVVPAPAFAVQPQNTTVKSGETATISVTATGAELTYQWYYTTGGTATKFYLSSNTTDTYTATMDVSRDGRQVYCVITDKYGNTAKSDTAVMTLEKTPLSIIQQPEDVTVRSGETARVTLQVSGDGLTYEWYYTTNTADTTFSKSSITGASYSTVMDLSRDGRKVYCVITDTYGQSVTTETATLSMEKVPLKITQQPASVTVKSGTTAKTTVKAEGDDLTYTWYFTSGGSSTKFSKSSITSATYSTTMEASRDGRKVYCIVTDAYGQSVTTETVTLAMEKTQLKINAQPASVTVVSGATAKTTVKAEGDGLTYTWYFTSGGSSTKFSKSSIKTATYSTTMSADRDGRKVYCIITDIYGQSVQTNTVTLSMKEAITITVQPKDVKVGNGETAKVTVEAQCEGLTYTWYYANKGKSSFTKSSIKTGTYSTIMDDVRDGRRVYCKITDKYGNSVKTATVTMYMYTPLEIVQQPKDVLAADGTTARTTVKVNGDGLTYTWYFTSGGSSTVFSKSSIKTATYSTTMDESRDGRQVYCVITDRYGESVTTNTVTLTMKPKTPLVITKQPEDVSVGGGSIAETFVGAEGDDLQYTWYFAEKGSSRFSKSSITGDTYSTTMSESKNGRKVYCIITDAYGDSVKTKTVTLSLKKSAFVILEEPHDVSVPNGATASTTVKAHGDGLTYVWYFTSNAADTTFSKSSVTGKTYSTVMDASRDGRQVYCRITDAYGRVIDTRTVTLTMDKQPAGEKVELLNHPESVTVAEGETASTTVLAYGDGLTYTWYYTSNGTTSKFYKSSNTTDTYSTVMDASRDGRQVYCVVTDRYGNSVTTHTAILSMKQSETEVSGKMGTVVSDNGINIRSGAGTGNSVVGTYGNGARVEILETKTVSGTVWGRTEKGWISMDYVQLDS